MRPGFDPFHGIAAVAWAARQAKPDCLLIGEYWQLPGTNPDKTATKLVVETEVGAVWNGAFHHTLDDVINQRWEWEKRDIFRAIGGFREEGFAHADAVVNYTCSHDEVRPEHEIKYYSGGNIKRPKGMSLPALALRKALLGLITLFGAPGVPMIYAGQEYGEDAPRTIDFCPLNWPRLERPEHARQLEIVKRLIAARRQYAALRGDSIRFEADDFMQDGLVRFVRTDEQGYEVWVALNFSGAPQPTCLPLAADQQWCDVVTQRLFVAQEHCTNFTLEPWQGMILVPT
jgi:1,4-alpha-glucan branching enzyme